MIFKKYKIHKKKKEKKANQFFVLNPIKYCNKFQLKILLDILMNLRIKLIFRYVFKDAIQRLELFDIFDCICLNVYIPVNPMPYEGYKKYKKRIENKKESELHFIIFTILLNI